jgi:hypothetical protein
MRNIITLLRFKSKKKSQERKKTTHNKKQMVVAMKNTLGNVTSSVELVGISRRTHYLWYNNDISYREKIDEIIERDIDFAEAALRKRIQNGDTTAIIFYLKTKAKDRGYIESQHSIITPLTANLMAQKTDEELDEILRRDPMQSF